MDQKETEHHDVFVNDFLIRFENLANTYIIDKLDDLRQNVEDLKIPFKHEYDIAMKTIETLEDHVKKTLKEVNKILTTWHVYKVFKLVFYNIPHLDIEDELENIFKKEYESFICVISSGFNNRLLSCDTRDRQSVRIVNCDKLFDDFINLDVENITKIFIQNLRCITGVDEVEK